MSFSNDPAGFVKVLAAGQESIAFGAAEDLAAFVDVTPYEYLLVIATCTIIGTSTGLTVKMVSSDVAAGTSPVLAKDSAAVDLVATLPATVPTLADGNTVMLQVRTRGLKKFASPQFTTATAAMGVSYVFLGICPKETSEIATGWIDESSSVVLEAGTFAP